MGEALADSVEAWVEATRDETSRSSYPGNKKQYAHRRELLPGYPREIPFESALAAEEYLANERLVCLRCGKSYKELGHHLARVHQWSADQYKLFYRLPLSPGRGLACPDTKELRRLSCKLVPLLNNGGYKGSQRHSGFRSAKTREVHAMEPKPCIRCGNALKYRVTNFCRSCWHEEQRSRRPQYRLVCETCGQWFLSKRKSARFCPGWKCHQTTNNYKEKRRVREERARRSAGIPQRVVHPKQDKPCANCGETFRVSRTRRHCCSRRCAARLRAGIPRPIQLPRPCIECGTPYKPLRRGRCNKCRLRERKRGTSNG